MCCAARQYENAPFTRILARECRRETYDEPEEYDRRTPAGFAPFDSPRFRDVIAAGDVSDMQARQKSSDARVSDRASERKIGTVSVSPTPGSYSAPMRSEQLWRVNMTAAVLSY